MNALNTRRTLLNTLAISVFGGSCAFAIPSPELIIGSVSSIGQISAVVFAMFSGGLATLAAKFGITNKIGITSGKLVALLLVMMLGLVALNIFQYNRAQSVLTERLQSTLFRPAQFSGTQIQDPTLKETSLDQQIESRLGITTNAAQTLLTQSKIDKDIVFLDIRETAEREMGGLVNSSHIRFPDIQADTTLVGKTVVLYCHNGNRSSETCAKLAAIGIDCRFIVGGLEKWIVEGREFSDDQVRGLSDLRAIPSFQNKDTLIDTKTFEQIVQTEDIQIIDSRYPGDFAAGHLPNAINIPLRALPTQQLVNQIETLEPKPTLVACYDRRSCFMGQVLGWELSNRGFDFRGRYTTPWDYFIAPKPKAHVVAWQAQQSTTFWQQSIDVLAGVLTWLADKSNFLVAIATLALCSRLLILPISLKAERDQILTKQNAHALKKIKSDLANQPVQRAKEIKKFYARNGITPVRNMTALIFLPVTMLGLSAVEAASKSVLTSLWWIPNLSEPDASMAMPLVFALLAGVYLHFAVFSTPRAKLLNWCLAVPLLFALTFQLSAAGNAYLCLSLALLLVQRIYVVGGFQRLSGRVSNAVQNWRTRTLYDGIIPLGFCDALRGAGNKSYRLSVMKNAGLPVPDGVVMNSGTIARYVAMDADQKQDFANRIWRMMGKHKTVVRSSASEEDAEDKSFAGVFDSVLNVQQDGMCDALAAVISSFSSERSARYDDLSQPDFDGNILIQKMVDATYSGVLFTQDPQAPGLMVLEMCDGTADDLVSGRVTPTTLYWGRYSHQRISPEAPPIDLQPLIKLGQDIETLFGCPQDIEWTFSDAGFEIVQSRDITTLNLGSATERARRQEWEALFENLTQFDQDALILEQDEMSEVLPRPTPLSFSVMAGVWSVGGSVDKASQSLGLNYNSDYNKPGHLVRFFGKLYSDSVLKQQASFRMSRFDLKRLRNDLGKVERAFVHDFLPSLNQKLIGYKSIDYEKLSPNLLAKTISELYTEFVGNTYVMAEKVNILANFTSRCAIDYCAENGMDAATYLNAEPEFSPTNLMRVNTDLGKSECLPHLLDALGHRSMFDYELSAHRYSEAPDMLWQLAKSSPKGGAKPPNLQSLSPEIENAVRFQQLKEHAKHESLRMFAELRRALLAFGSLHQLDGLQFYLEIGEIIACDTDVSTTLRERAQERKRHDAMLNPYAPKQAHLTLKDCEILSSLHPISPSITADEVAGTRVSGEGGVQGVCYVVDDQDAQNGAPLTDFRKGDILVCQMVHPAWLPQVIEAGAVLSTVGGWLSHMAIVAREKNVTMLVGCQGLDRLVSGTEIEISPEGEIQITQEPVSAKLKIAGE